ncbi:MAG: zinc-dependent metalloprotease [Chitinophagales bacterium]
MKKIITLLFIACISISFAQQMGSCGTHMTHEDMQSYYQRDVSHLNHNSRALVEIPVAYHIINQDDGTGGFALDDLLDLHCNVNDDFAPADIQFIIVDILNIDSNYFYDWDDGNAGNNLMDSFNIDNVCNIYLSPNAKSGTTPVCGYSFVPQNYAGPNRGGIVLANNCANPGSSTLSHEMGHYLNLPHTFSGWEGQDSPDENSPAPATIGWWGGQVETVARTNCSNAGDGFCGTLPDYISDRWNCNGNGESQEFQDPNGVDFRIDGSNYMSYANDGCHNHFSVDQQSEVNAAPANYRSYLLEYDLESYQPVTATTDIIFPQDNAEYITNSNLNLRWESVEHADYYFVQLAYSSFFNTLIDTIVTDTSLIVNNLLDNRDYVWRVLPFNYRYTCGDYYTSTIHFKTSTFSGDVLTTSPDCPGENSTSGSAQFSNPLGSDIYTWSSIDPILNSQIQGNTSFNANNIAAGNYMLEVNRGGEILIIDFVVQTPPDFEIEFVNSTSNIVANITGGTPPYTTIAWSNGQSGMTNSTPNNGLNTLTIIDSKGCVFSKSTTYNSTVIAIEDEEIALNTTTIYPNPLANDILNIEMSLIDNENVSFEVYNIAGQQVANQNEVLSSGDNLVQINLTDVSKGVYFVKTTIDQYSRTEKLVILK